MSAPLPSRIEPPPASVLAAARTRVGDLATPAGALGRLGELGAWLAATQGEVPPRPLDDVRLVVFAGDHGVAAHGVSAYPAAVTEAMVRTLVSGRAGVSALAAAHGVSVRVLDISVDADLSGLPPDVVAHKVCRGSAPLHLTDALSAAESEAALEVGRNVARREVSDGAQVLISGDLGIGNTTPAAALVAAVLGMSADEVTGRGTGIDDAGWATKRDVVAQGLARAGERASDPSDALTALGGADLAASVGFMVAAAQARVPVVLDGLMSVTCALLAERLAPGAAAWFVAGHRSTEPAQTHALKALGLDPLLDIGMRLGEGSGAVVAVPLLRSAVALVRDVALLSEVLGG